METASRCIKKHEKINGKLFGIFRGVFRQSTGAYSNFTAKNAGNRGVYSNRHGSWLLGLKRPLERVGPKGNGHGHGLKPGSVHVVQKGVWLVLKHILIQEPPS
jgi:hypothetical protein